MESPGLPPTGPVPRLPFQLRSLPIGMRWEVTRRHPYYQAFWKPARAFHRNDPLSYGAAEPLLRVAAVASLRMIGVVGEPPDPKTPFSALGESNLNPAWLSGAVHPVSLRGMAAVLLASLSKDALSTLGLLFAEASCEDPEAGPARVLTSMMDLQASDKPDFDNYPDEPFVSINPAASVSQLQHHRVLRTFIRDVVTPLTQEFPTQDEEIGFADGRLHSFRHFFCSTCANNNVPEQMVMRWLGHRSSEMVRHYYHLHDDEAKRQMNQLNFLGEVGGWAADAPHKPEATED